MRWESLSCLGEEDRGTMGGGLPPVSYPITSDCCWGLGGSFGGGLGGRDAPLSMGDPASFRLVSN